ncbi:hypothetical protein [Phaeobacter italicus]|jgi:hypothetical protein|uniref:hypothetical protein n=1 Tax=Phaeobacter italicus TaxID=481446 RepID=UPI002FDD1AC1
MTGIGRSDMIDPKLFEEYEKRLAALEAVCLSKEEREINLLVIRIVRSVKMTLWLTNGAVKYGAAPVGMIWGLWLYGEQVIEFIKHMGNSK